MRARNLTMPNARRGRDGFTFKLQHLHEFVFEVGVYKNTVLVITHTFQSRKGAVRWAEEARHLIAKSVENREHR